MLFYKRKLDDTDFTSTRLLGSTFKKAKLFKTNLTRVELTGCDFTDAQMNATILCEANLTEAIINDANLSKANLTSVNLTTARIEGAKLDGAILYQTHAVGTIFAKSSVRNMDASRADLIAASLHNIQDWETMILTSANLTGI